MIRLIELPLFLSLAIVEPPTEHRMSNHIRINTKCDASQKLMRATALKYAITSALIY